jgi:preprotein translocase subunit SecF
VVFDRIREMLRKYKKMPTEEMLDISMNSTLSRTVMTSVTTSLALIALVMFGGKVIQSFSWAMIFGVVIGTYSSIFIAAPVLIYLGVKVGGEAPAASADQAAAPTPPRRRQGQSESPAR